MFGALRRLLRAVLALPTPARRALAGPTVVRDGQTLDLDVQLVLRLLGLIAPGDEPSLVDQRRATDRAAGLAESLTPGVTARELTVPVPAGPGRDVPGTLPACLYEPAEVGDRPAGLLVHFHGGGFALGSIASSAPLCRVLAATRASPVSCPRPATRCSTPPRPCARAWPWARRHAPYVRDLLSHSSEDRARRSQWSRVFMAAAG
jgi:acetyl esterase/lipase